jgi:hypothetical protein
MEAEHCHAQRPAADGRPWQTMADYQQAADTAAAASRGRSLRSACGQTPMSEDPSRMARARRQAAVRNPRKAAQHLLSAALLDPPTPDYFGREISRAAQQTKRNTRAAIRAAQDKGIK